MAVRIARRAKNTGGITAIGPDHWRVRWRDTGGRQRERTVHGPKAAAEAALRAALVDTDRGITSVDRELSVADWLETWLGLVRPGLALRSRTHYERTVRQHLVPAFGRRRLGKLDERHVAAMMDHWSRTGASDAAVIWRVNILRMALGRAVKARKISLNVATLVDLPSHRRTRPDPPSDATVDAILGRIKGHPYEIAYALAIGTGMRLGEISALRWSDIDLGARTIHIHLSRIYGTDILKVTKTEAGDRTFVMPSWLAVMLAERRGAPEAFVVVTRTMRPTAGRNLNRKIHQICDELGLPRTNLRQIRHYAVTRMLEAGVDPVMVSRAVGHSSIKITVDTYGHVRPDRRVADAMER